MNNNYGRILVLLGLVLLLASCFNRRVGKGTVLDPITITGKATGLDLYRASAPMVWDIVHTRVALNFNMAEKTANGKAWISMHPYIYPTDTIMVDAKGMSIEAVTLGESTPLTYQYNDNKLKIKLNGTSKTEDTIQISVSYKAMPYAATPGGSAAISEDRGLYFINTDHAIPGKPVQIWTQGETESNSHWMPTFDQPNERFTTQIELTVADSFKTLSNGYLFSQVKAGNGLRTDTWIMEKPIQPYACMFAIGNFDILRDEWRGREVSYYVEPGYTPYARLMFKNTPEMMEYFSINTGVPYPWNKYSQVVVRDYISGAMENTTATVFGEFMNQNAREIADKDNEDVVSHELFHQWFGDYVTAESWSNLTVNESFANYGEQLWRRHKYGDVSADELAFDELWKYLSAANQAEPPLVRYKYASQEEMFDLISYQKGGAILNYLHHLAGDAAFFKAMNLYLKQNALKPAEATHWRLALEEATGKDWNWFFNQWYYRGGFPELDIEYEYGDKAGQLSVSVTQKQDSLYTLPLKTEVVYNDHKTTIDWDIRNRKEIFTYPYQNGIKPVIIPDAEHWLVGKIKEDKEPGDWLVQFINSEDNVISKRYAIGAVSKKLDDSASQAVFSLALRDREAGIRELVLQNIRKLTNKKWQDKWKQDIAFMAMNDGSSRVRTAAFDVLADWKTGSSGQDMFSALSDSSYNVAGAALRGLNKLKYDTAYSLSQQILKTDPKGRLLYTAIDIIAEAGRAQDIDLFEQKAMYFYGTGKIEFAHSLAGYMQNVADFRSFERAADLYPRVITSEGISVYRYAMATFFFELAREYKDKVMSARKNAEKEGAQKRLDILNKVAAEIIRSESSEKQ